MADALISTVLDRLISAGEQQIRDEVKLVLGVDAEIQCLKDTLRSLRDVIDDAERRQVEDRSVRGWLEKLKDMAYQMDDVVDEWSTSLLRLQIEDASMSKKKVSRGVPSPFFCVRQIAHRRDIALKIRSIKEQLDAIDQDSKKFNFVSARIEKPLHPVTTSGIEFSEVCGREMDKETIIGHLLGKKGEQGSGLYIVTIVGVGGMGKTTLAQLAYNHPNVEAHFDERIWACVSNPFEPAKIFRDIVKLLANVSPNLHSLVALRKEVQNRISEKKFLLVLDDVWNEDFKLWEQVKKAFSRGAAGSRILVTTRKDSVANLIESTYTHPLGELSGQQSRALFHRIAFSRKSSGEEEQLKEIGDKIANKCKGLPLAIKTLGNLMRLKNGIDEWEAVLENEVWEKDVIEKDFSPALLLSYYDLPPAIRRCFSFCAVFPKDKIIERDDLIKVWMAHNYLSRVPGKEMEMVGREYFEYLAAVCFFQDFEKNDAGEIIRCRMHEIVHDFAQLLAKNECFIMVSDEQKERNIDKNRHTTLIVREGSEDNVNTSTMKHLHTLLVLHSDNSKLITPLFQHLRCLRALRLGNNYHLKELQDDVKELMHLRYLDLSGSSMLRELPESICNLYNFQTLNIRGCDALEKLPQAMDKLVNLRHLANSRTHALESLPKGLGTLTSLQTLEEFIISSDGDDKCKIGDLRYLNQLKGTLTIKRLYKVKEASEAEEAELEKKIHLRHLYWTFPMRSMKVVAEALKPPPKLETLHLDSYPDVMLPSWMLKSSLTHLRRLVLSRCPACSSMPPLGELAVLEYLEIQDMVSVKNVGDEFLGSSSTFAFPKLKMLTFKLMRNWGRWEIKEKEERSVMPSLNVLIMRKCPKLKGLPEHVLRRTTLQRLKIIDSPALKQQHEKDLRISHIPITEFN